MPAFSFQLISSALISALLLFNISLPHLQVTAKQYRNSIIYTVQTKDGPAKVQYKKPNTIIVSYKKNGQNTEFFYKRDQESDILPEDAKVIDSIVEKVIKDGERRGLFRRAHDELVRFKDWYTRKPVR